VTAAVWREADRYVVLEGLTPALRRAGFESSPLKQGQVTVMKVWREVVVGEMPSRDNEG
jgi:hypothetical protein